MVSNQSLKFAIKEINSSSEYLPSIVQLGDANSATLGFLPHGAYKRLADKNRLLACINSEKVCVGYLLYDTSGYKVKLTHLCVHEAWRGKGIAKLLIQHLKQKTSYFYGILASCRRDYNLDRMWTSLGFSAVYERIGRSSTGSILTEWWLDYGHPNLLTELTKKAIEFRITAAIDANILALPYLW